MFFRTRETRYGVEAALTLAVQSYFGWYSTFHLAMALVVLVSWEGVRERGRWRELPWMRMGLLALLCAVLVLPSALPYLLQSRTLPEFDRPFSETVRLSADIVDYLRVSRENVLAQLVPAIGARWAGFFPGLMAVTLATLGLVAIRRTPDAPSPTSSSKPRGAPVGGARVSAGGRGETGYLIVLGLTGLVLSLGPFLHIAGYRLPIPLPYAICYYVVPGFSSMRTPGRFAVLVALATAVLAGLGYDALRRRAPLFRSGMLIVTLLVAGFLAWCPTLPFVAYSDRDSMPPVYGWLAAQTDSLPLLELPMPAGERWESTTDLHRQMYVLFHGTPRLDGTSGFVSNRYEAFRSDMQAFPEEHTIRRAYQMGARRLIVHYGDYPAAARDRIRRQVEKLDTLSEAAAFDFDRVYEIEGR